MKKYIDMVELFERVNQSFLSNAKELLQTDVNERTLCGEMMKLFHKEIEQDQTLNGYYADVEYNRNKGALKTICKTIKGPEYKIIKINCDLILHSRGKHPEQDNLIAIEMKKTSAPSRSKQSDRERLIALTKDSFDDIWTFDGYSLPEHVCRYVLGVYYEINFRDQNVYIEYYQHGALQKQCFIPYS